MKHYNQPETKILQVMNSSVICTSVPGPVYNPVTGQLGTMTKTSGSWD